MNPGARTSTLEDDGETLGLERGQALVRLVGGRLRRRRAGRPPHRTALEGVLERVSFELATVALGDGPPRAGDDGAAARSLNRLVERLKGVHRVREKNHALR